MTQTLYQFDTFLVLLALFGFCTPFCTPKMTLRSSPPGNTSQPTWATPPCGLDDRRPGPSWPPPGGNASAPGAPRRVDSLVWSSGRVDSRLGLVGGPPTRFSRVVSWVAFARGEGLEAGKTQNRHRILRRSRLSCEPEVAAVPGRLTLPKKKELADQAWSRKM